MTTIAFRDGIMAADSRVTVGGDEEGSAPRTYFADKLYRKTIQPLKRKPVLRTQSTRWVPDGDAFDVIIGLAGESTPGLVFLDWYGSGEPEPESISSAGSDADFTALILTPEGLFEADAYCRPERVLNEFYAVGSGANAAMGALYAGATAEQAVEIASRIDLYTAGPIKTMRL